MMVHEFIEGYIIPLTLNILPWSDTIEKTADEIPQH